MTQDINNFHMDETKALIYIIGYLTISWSLLERGLDRIAITIYKGCAGHTIKRKIPPLLKPKLEFISDAFQNLPVLAEYKVEGCAIIEHINKISTKRHDLIHSTIMDFAPKLNSVFAFSKYDFDNNKVKLRHISISPLDLQEFSQNVESLAEDTAYFSDRLLKTFLLQP